MHDSIEKQANEVIRMTKSLNIPNQPKEELVAFATAVRSYRAQIETLFKQGRIDITAAVQLGIQIPTEPHDYSIYDK